MQSQRDFLQVWKDLASMIKTLPPEEQRRYQLYFGLLAHDLRQVIGIIYSAESLLRRKKGLPPGYRSDMIRNASKRAMGLVSDFAQPFDGQITLPLSRPSEDPEK